MLTSPPSAWRGALKPRVEVAPPYVATFGDLAADLMEAAGKPLEQWQRESVDLMMSTRVDGRWACYEYAEWVARQNGKGGLGEARALTGFFVLGEELIIWSAHEYKTAMEAFRRMRTLIRKLGTPISDTLVDVDGVMVKISNTNGEEGFERLDNEQRIRFVARSKSSGRGFSGDVNIIDEAFAYTTDQAEALGPTLIARPNAQIIYLSSPPLTGDTGEIMFALKERAEAGGDESLGYRDWGIEGNLEELGKVDLDDPAVWARANPALGLGRVTLETIRRLRKMLSANEGKGFAREVLGLWPKKISGGGAIDMDRWRKLIDLTSKRDGDIALGVDISPARDYAAISVYGLRPDGLGHMQLVLYKPGTAWLAQEIYRWRDILDPVAVGMGPSTFASLKVELTELGITESEDPENPLRGELAVTASREMTAAVGHMLDAVRDGTFRHLGQKELTDSVAGAKARQTGDALVWALKESSNDTSPLVSATVAKRTFEARAHLVQNANYDVLQSVY